MVVVFTQAWVHASWVVCGVWWAWPGGLGEKWDLAPCCGHFWNCALLGNRGDLAPSCGRFLELHRVGTLSNFVWLGLYRG